VLTLAPLRRKRAKAASGGSGYDQLVGMGFSAQAATAALVETEGDVERAVAWLFANPQ